MNSKSLLIQELLKNESFLDWVNGNASTKDAGKWQNWLNESPLHKAAYDEILPIVQNIQFSKKPMPNVDYEWDKLYLNISPEMPKVPDKSVAQFESQGSSIFKLSKFYQYAGAALATAAAFLLIVWFGGLSTDKTVEVIATAGEQIRVVLPDESIVIVNGNSSLKYSENWNSGETLIAELTGEAFFNVKKMNESEKREFVVLTPAGKITVLGTQFLVKNRNKQTYVNLKSGSVQVSSNQLTAILKPDEWVRLYENIEQLLPQPLKVEQQIVWWEDTENLKLNNTPLPLLLTYLENTYSVNFEMNNISIDEMRVPERLKIPT